MLQLTQSKKLIRVSLSFAVSNSIICFSRGNAVLGDTHCWMTEMNQLCRTIQVGCCQLIYAARATE